MNDKINILIVDDHQIVVDGLVSMLQTEKKFDIKTASNGEAALTLISKKGFDIYLFDIGMPIMNGIELSKTLLKKDPGSKIIILTTHNDKEIIIEMLHIGVSGYVVKNCTREELLSAIHKVRQGKSFFSDDVHEALRHHFAETKSNNLKEEEVIITKREKEIVRLLAKEYTNERIAIQMNLSYRTIETHRKNVMHKTKSHNLAGLLNYFYSKGLL